MPNQNLNVNCDSRDAAGKLKRAIVLGEHRIVRVVGIWKIGKSQAIADMLELLRRDRRGVEVAWEPGSSRCSHEYKEVSGNNICTDLVSLLEQRFIDKELRLSPRDVRVLKLKFTHFKSLPKDSPQREQTMFDILKLCYENCDMFIIHQNASKEETGFAQSNLVVKNSRLRFIIEQRQDYLADNTFKVKIRSFSDGHATGYLKNMTRSPHEAIHGRVSAWAGKHPGLLSMTIPFDLIRAELRRRVDLATVEEIIETHMEENKPGFSEYSEALYSSLHPTAQQALRTFLSSDSGQPDPIGKRLLENAGLLVEHDNDKKLIKFLSKFPPKSALEPPEPDPSISTPSPVCLKITISSQKEQMGISCDGDVGQADDSSTLPFDEEQLVAVLKALDPGRQADFNESQKTSLRALGLWDDDNMKLRQNYRELVGVKLFEALFAGRIEEALERAEGRRDRRSISLELRFAHDEVLLARYPWELLCKQTPREFMLRSYVDLVRYVTFPEAPSRIKGESPCRLLYVRPRPTDLPFPEVDKEREIVWNTLLGDKAANIIVNDGTIRTYSELQIALMETKAPIHLIHFDGHGMFGRMCSCRELNYAHSEKCEKCHASLKGTTPEGFLAFEKEGKCDLVGADYVSGLLSRNGDVRFVFLSACASAVVRGDSVFGGVAPRLIGSKVPAVVAMQSSITFEDTTKFAEAFYRNLASGKTIPQAVWSGRQTLRSNESWFVPTVYLRADDGGSGRLFEVNEEG